MNWLRWDDMIDWERDHMVAEKIFLGHPPELKPCKGFPFPPEVKGAPPSWFHWVGVPPFSTDIAAAWEVVEKMGERGLYFQVEDGCHPDKKCAFFHGKEDTVSEGVADTAPEAICLAALRAVGVEV